MEDALLFTQQSRYFVVFSNDRAIGTYDTFAHKPEDVIQEKNQTYANVTWKYADEPVKIKKC